MTTTGQRLPVKVLASYSFSSFATNSMWMLNNYFLLFFYTDVIRIPAAAATVIFMIARIWDAINDPMMGVLCDKTHSAEGKSRFWLKRVAIPGGVFLALSYFCPQIATGGRILWAGAAYILQGMAQTAIGIPNASLTLAITQDRTERVRLQQYTAIPSALANFLIPAATMPFVRMFGEANMRAGFFVLASVLGILYALSTICVYISTKGLDPDTSRHETSDDESAESSAQASGGDLSTLQLIRAALKNRYIVLVVCAYMTYLLLAGIMGGSLIYYFRYVVGNECLMAVYSSAAVIGMFVSIILMRAISRKIGNARTCMVGAVICAAAMVPRIITGDRSIAVFAVCMVALGIGSGFISEMMHQCKFDAATYGKLHGDDNPSVVVSLFTFGQKFGQAISSVIAAALLAAFHYTAGEVPGEAVQKLFYTENIIFPIVVAAIITVFLIAISRMEKQLVIDLAEADHKEI